MFFYQDDGSLLCTSVTKVLATIGVGKTKPGRQKTDIFVTLPPFAMQIANGLTNENENDYEHP